MNINYKHFNFGSLETELKDFEYTESKTINYNSIYDGEFSLNEIFSEMNKVINELILKIPRDINKNAVVSQTKSLFTDNELLNTNESLEKVIKVLLSYE